MSDIDDCRKSVERLTRDRGEVMRAGEEKIEEIRARHKAGPLGQMPREDRMSSHLRWRWLLGEVDRRGAEIERLRAENERLLQAVGLATTAVPDMEIDIEDPVGMMQRVVAKIERLRAALRECACACSSIRECVSEWARDGKCPHADACNALEGKP